MAKAASRSLGLSSHALPAMTVALDYETGMKIRGYKRHVRRIQIGVGQYRVLDKSAASCEAFRQV